MTLFEFAPGSRVRLHSKVIRYHVADDQAVDVAYNVTWEGIATDQYFVFYNDERRRLVINVSSPLPALRNRGVWLRDVPCELA